MDLRTKLNKTISSFERDYEKEQQERMAHQLRLDLNDFYEKYGIAATQSALMESGFWLTQVPAEVMRGNFEQGYFGKDGEAL